MKRKTKSYNNEMKVNRDNWTSNADLTLIWKIKP